LTPVSCDLDVILVICGSDAAAATNVLISDAVTEGTFFITTSLIQAIPSRSFFTNPNFYLVKNCGIMVRLGSANHTSKLGRVVVFQHLPGCKIGYNKKCTQSGW